MAGITLAEAAKLALANGEVKRAGVITLFAEKNPLLRAMTFMNIAGNAYAYNQEGALPGIAWRGVNESYTASAGVINPAVEPLKIIGGDLDVDLFNIATAGPTVRSTHEAMKIKALADEVGYSIVNGNSASDPREIDGLYRRVTGAQVRDNATAGAPQWSSGTTEAALSCFHLDTLIDTCEGCTHLLMSKNMGRQLKRYLRTVGSIAETTDVFSQKVYRYRDVELLEADEFGTTAMLGTTEAYPLLTGNSTNTSIYALHIEDGWFSGIQNGVMRVDDLQQLQTAPVMRTRIEWYMGICIMHPRAVARLVNVKSDTAAVA